MRSVPSRRFLPVLALVLAASSVVAVTSVTSAGAAAASTPFRDVSASDPHRSAISELAGRDITLGCAPQRYCPQRPVTRGQIASFLTRAFDLPSSTEMPFTDVPASSTHADAIAAVAAAGVARGVDSDTFAPNELVRRDQMASLLAAAMDLDGNAGSVPFSDVSTANVHASSIEAIASAGVAQGRNGGTFSPSADVTRAQMASFLVRSLESPTSTAPTRVSSWPTAETTGVPAGTQLSPSGSVSTSHDGQVIENLEVTGRISVSHSNVTIRNVRVLGTGRYGIEVPHGSRDDVRNLVIEDTEIRGISGERSSGLVHYGQWTARRVDVSGFADGVKIGSNQTLEESWIHDLHVSSGSHNDGIQAVGGHDITIRGNSVQGQWQGQTSAILLQTNNGPISDVVIEGNRLSGGGYTLYVTDKGNGHGEPTNVTVRDNVWVGNSWSFGPTRTDTGSGWMWTGNRTDGGVTVD